MARSSTLRPTPNLEDHNPYGIPKIHAARPVICSVYMERTPKIEVITAVS
jgi:hypothetical protein